MEKSIRHRDIRKIEGIIKKIEKEWLDHSGGLTWAGSDVVRVGTRAIQDIEAAANWSAEQKEAAVSEWWAGFWCSSSGAEADICVLAQAAIAA